MIRPTSEASLVPARTLPSRTAPSARPADPEAAERFGELVRAEPEAKGSQSKDQRARRRPTHTSDNASEANPFAQPAGAEAIGHKSAPADRHSEPGDANRGEIAADHSYARQPGAAAVEARASAGPAPSEAAFTAMLDRVHLQQGQSHSQTVLSMTDARWLAQQAIVTQSNAGGLSLSLSMNMENGSNEALDELRRRLEARGLAVDHVTAAGRLGF